MTLSVCYITFNENNLIFKASLESVLPIADEIIVIDGHSTDGTLIKYHLPAGKSGHVKFVIYNVAGEKVRTIDETIIRTSDSTNYSEWDGKNDKGTKVASGVYFMLTYLNGEQLGNKAHKMALIK